MSVSNATRRAMGTTAAVTVHGGRLDADDVLAEIDRLEQSWSRFRPDSELSRLNDCSGSLTVVSATLLVLVEHLMAAHRLTGGRFDPTMGAHIAALGYDRTYRDLSDGSRPVRPLPDVVGADDIVVIPSTSAVLLPAGVRERDPGRLPLDAPLPVPRRLAVAHEQQADQAPQPRPARRHPAGATTEENR